MMKLFRDEKQAYRVRLAFGVLLALFAVPLWVMSEAGFDTFWYTVPLIVLMQGYLVVRFSNVQLMIIGTLYLFIYFLYLIPYFYSHSQLSEHSEYQNFGYFTLVLFLFYLFYSGLVLSAAKEFNPDKKKLRDLIVIPSQGWKTFAYIVFTFAALALVFRQGENVLGATNPYAAYKENLENVNALPLMFVLFLVFVYFIVKAKKLRNLILAICFVGLLYFSVTRGFRMVLAPLGLAFFALYFDNRFKTKTLILGMVLAYFGLIFVNSLKSGEDLEWGDFISESDEFILSHHADNLYGSAAGVGLLETGSIKFDERVMLNVGFFGEAICPPSVFPDKMKYPHIIGINAATGGGGLFVTGAYMMWGFIGVLVFGYLLGWFVRQTYVRKNSLWALCCLVVLIFVPRWMSYDFHVLLRFSVMATVIYLLLTYVVVRTKSIDRKQ